MSNMYGRSWTWYLLPIFFNIFGGLFAYYMIRNDDPKKAQECLNIGIVLFAVQIVIILINVVVSMSPFTMLDSTMSIFDESLSSSDIVIECLRDSAGFDNSIDSVDTQAFSRCLKVYDNGGFAP